MGSSSNRYAPRLPQQETKPSTKQLAPTDPILGPEHLLKTGFAQKGLPSTMDAWKSTSERNLRRLYSLPIERFSQPFYRQLHKFFTFFARPLTMLASFNVHVSTTRDFLRVQGTSLFFLLAKRRSGLPCWFMICRDIMNQGVP